MAEKVFTATGRRKTSVARVFLRSGKGNITINDKSLQEYFGRETARMIVLQPFEVTQTSGNFDIDVNVGSFDAPQNVLAFEQKCGSPLIERMCFVVAITRVSKRLRVIRLEGRHLQTHSTAHSTAHAQQQRM